ncbi:CSEP0343 putative effector protein [Blumeria hordei DH14]|uniref:CSEP0343 putative effector protein n=1 Tax=Blumeria graminis f. sp. hordei (strain DH14) TaxID=546991 RepID=N1J915_BLUG1|nr:CSEP0343 putative effector protein [Blumeria hordei DH14]
MKLFTISGAAKLFFILAPVIAMPDNYHSGSTPVPDQDNDFSFYCPSDQIYNKNYLISVVQEARQIMRDSYTQYVYPSTFNHFNYDIIGELWHYPLTGNDKPMKFSCFARFLKLINGFNVLVSYGAQDFVVFNTNNDIAGVAHRKSVNGRSIFEPCSLLG